MSRIDEFAEAAKRRLGAGRLAELAALNETLFGVLGFRGNFDDYYDPKNSFLNEVIDRRTGIPITMSVLYMGVGRRIGMDLEGLSFPGHFLVRYVHSDAILVLDPFHMGISLSTDEMRTRAERALGSGSELSPRFLEPATPRQIIRRLLINLGNIYRRDGDAIRQLAVVERLAILDPDNNTVRAELEKLRRRAQDLN
jgi:regulator of sirC expression with transglutaminase-like and TPR domain